MDFATQSWRGGIENEKSNGIKLHAIQVDQPLGEKTVEMYTILALLNARFGFESHSSELWRQTLLGSASWAPALVLWWIVSRRVWLFDACRELAVFLLDTKTWTPMFECGDRVDLDDDTALEFCLLTQARFLLLSRLIRLVAWINSIQGIVLRYVTWVAYQIIQDRQLRWKMAEMVWSMTRLRTASLELGSSNG